MSVIIFISIGLTFSAVTRALNSIRFDLNAGHCCYVCSNVFHFYFSVFTTDCPCGEVRDA